MSGVRGVRSDERRREAGTTLVEVVVATAVVGIAVVALGGLSGSLAAKVGTDALRAGPIPRTALVEAVGRAVRSVERVEAATARSVTVAGAVGPTTVTIGDAGELVIIGPEGPSPIDPEARTDVRRLAYLTDAGELIEVAPGAVLTGAELVTVTAVVLLDDDGGTLGIVALRDRGGR